MKWHGCPVARVKNGAKHRILKFGL
jgi:hypothetical protein